MFMPPRSRAAAERAGRRRGGIVATCVLRPVAREVADLVNPCQSRWSARSRNGSLNSADFHQRDRGLVVAEPEELLDVAPETADSWQKVLEQWGVPAAVVAGIVVLLALPKIFETLVIYAKAIRRGLAFVSPNALSPARRSALLRRQRIARLALQSLDLTESLTGWDPDQFVEVRASVEAIDTPRRVRGWWRRSQATFRTKKLDEALLREVTSLINLQGPPGSGKSVILRNFSRRALTKAAERHRALSPLAFYVNLREFAPATQTPTVQDLQDFVRMQVNPTQAPDLDEYLQQEFSDDLRDGQVTLLLDSFDEIPAIVGSMQNAAVVTPYVRVIQDLMAGGAAKCVVASREYGGPHVPGWTRLQLVPFSEAEQLQLLNRYVRDPARRSLVIDYIREDYGPFNLRNPLELALFCRFVAQVGAVPARRPDVYAELVESQLKHALASLELDEAGVLSAVQRIAYVVTAEESMGLHLDRGRLEHELRSAVVHPQQAGELLDRLIESKLMIRAGVRHNVPTYAFAHRRIQEFLATDFILVHRDEVDISEVAWSPKWREIAVAVLQLGNEEVSQEILQQALETLRGATVFDIGADVPFDWDPASMHTLEMLLAAFGRDPRQLADETRTLITRVCLEGWRMGGISERKFALDCAVLALPSQRADLVNRAFSGSSHWLRVTALRRCAQLSPLPESVEGSIRRLLVTLMRAGQLRHDAPNLDADLSQLYRGAALVRVRRLLAAVPTVVVLLCLGKVAADFVVFSLEPLNLRSQLLLWLLLPLTLFWWLQSTQPLSYRTTSRWGALGVRMMSLAGWPQESDTQTFWWLVRLVAAIQVLLDVSLACIGLFWGGLTPIEIVGRFLLVPLLSIYALLWGGATILRIGSDRGAEVPALRWLLRAPIGSVRRLAGTVRDNFWVFVKAAAYLIVGQALLFGVFFGISYVLSHYAGRIGDYVWKVIAVVFLALWPVILLVSAVRLLLQHRQVRRTAGSSKRLTEEQLMDDLRSFKTPMDAAEYLRMVMRVRSDELRRNVGRLFVQTLLREIEAGQVELPVSSLARRYVTNPSEWLASGVACSDEVVDELGRMSEFLRAAG